MTYGELLEALALAPPGLPVRVKLGNGQLREVAAADLDVDVTDLGTVEAATGEPQREHRLVGIILRME